MDINGGLKSIENIATTLKDVTDSSNALVKDSIDSASTAATASADSETTNVASISVPDAIKAMETSKRLLWVFVIFFIVSFAAIGIVAIVFKKDISYMLNYQVPITTTTVVGYMAKAGIENFNKNK